MTGLHYDCIGIVDCDMIMDCTGVAVGWRFAVGDGGSVFLGLAPRLDWIVLGYCCGCDLGGRVWYQVLGCGTPWTPDAVRSRNPGAMEERGRPRNPCLVLYTLAVSVL